MSKKYDSYDNLGFKSEVENSNKLNEIEEKFNSNNIKELNSPKTEKKTEKKEEKSPKMKKKRKVSIYFKGKKDKLARSMSLDSKELRKLEEQVEKKTEEQKTDPKNTSKNSIFEDSKPKDSKNFEPEKIINSDAKTSKKNQKDESKNTFEPEKLINSDTGKTSSDSKTSYDRKHRKSSSTSPERRHHKHDEKKGHRRRHKKSDRLMIRRPSTSVERRERSYSVCTDRSHILDHRFHFDETNSERERTNSISSCESVRSRKVVPSFAVTGKIPWFGCWGNGCI